MTAGTFLLELFTRYFRRTPVPETFSANVLATPGCIIITQSSSVIPLALLQSFARRSGLKGIQDARELLGSTPASKDPSKIAWVSIHDEAALEALAACPQVKALSTFNVFYARGPINSNPTHHFGFRRSLAMLILSRFLIVVFGNPITTTTPEKRTRMKLSRILKLDFYRNLKVVRGTPFQSIEVQAHSVLGGAEYERELGIIAQRSRESKEHLRRRARKAFFDMAANPRAAMFWLLAPLAHFIVTRLFREVAVTGLSGFEAAVRENTVIVVPMHRSHLDYIILGSTLYQSRINPPVVAAGVNLSFWPVGFFIRSLGAYFVKRNARHDRLHALLLRRYVTYLVKRGHSQEFFIEGGRSRSGKMRPPKIGILSIIIDAYVKGLRRNILFVPVSISYENVIEDKVFGDENTGQKKEKENVFALLKARSVFRQKYGEVSVRFGTPLALDEFAQEYRRQQEAGPKEEKSLVLQLGHVLTRKIRDQTALSLSSLAYTALLNAPRYSLSRDQLSTTIKNLAALAAIVQRLDSEGGERTPALKDFLAGDAALLNDLPRGGTISVRPYLNEDIFLVVGKQRFTADFYKNSTLHLFFGSSLLAILELLQRPLTAEEAGKLHDMFEMEFLLPSRDVFQNSMRALINEFRKEGILTDDAKPKFKRKDLGIFTPGMLLSSVQSMLWVVHFLNYLSKLPKPATGAGDSSTVDYDDLLSHLQNDFKTAAYSGLVSRTEAGSQASLTAALETLQQRRFINVQDGASQSKEISVLRELDAELALLKEINYAVLIWQYSRRPEDLHP
jgi:glycerol-3-phosphate O-acyltransferase